MNQVEVFRARNKFYNDLIQYQNSQELAQGIAWQLLYLGRRVPRSEIAQRISHFDSEHLTRVARHWFYDRVNIFCGFFGGKLLGGGLWKRNRISQLWLGGQFTQFSLTEATTGQSREALLDGWATIICTGLSKLALFKLPPLCFLRL